MMTKVLIIFILSFAVEAHTPKTTYDHDLAPSLKNTPLYDDDFFNPDEISYQQLENPQQVAVRVKILSSDGTSKLIPGISVNTFIKGKVLRFDANSEVVKVSGCQDYNQTWNNNTYIRTAHFKIENHKEQEYELLFKGKCGHLTELIFEEESFAGGLLSVYNLALIVVEKLSELELIEHWNKQQTIVYPSGGNFYDFDKVHVDKGHHWDIVTHEIGHAVYDMFNIGRFTVGPHYIDECYSPTLALSEGWPSFFAAWVHLDLDNPLAQFEYMVPRRAPLSLEYVPDDVCKGEGNEWRVFAFLWDIVDHHDDGERLKVSMKDLMHYSLNAQFKSAADIKKKLEIEGFDPIMLNIAWKQNILGE